MSGLVCTAACCHLIHLNASIVPLPKTNPRKDKLTLIIGPEIVDAPKLLDDPTKVRIPTPQCHRQHESPKHHVPEVPHQVL